jgi:2'-5' RNA ligase
MSDKPRRLFLALWPPAAERARMAALTCTLSGGRKVHPDNLHLTLVFLGATRNECLLCYEQALRGLIVPTLTLILDRLGYWSRSGILWLGASQIPAELITLVQELNRRLESCGFSSEERPFQAHITLARDWVGPAPLTSLAEPLSWQVDQVVMVESRHEDTGRRYEVIGRWPQG